jgi:putative transposase
MYLVAVMDWFSRYVLSWAVSITMDVDFCLEALDHALEVARPEIFNSDQGAQFTSLDFTGRLVAAGIQISMDGRGRALDNVFIERLWRTVKYEEVYVKDYETPREAMQGFATFFVRYNEWRQHQALQRFPVECATAELYSLRENFGRSLSGNGSLGRVQCSRVVCSMGQELA